jgi:hypothetical protein
MLTLPLPRAHGPNDPEAAERGRVGVINLLAFKWFFSRGNGRVAELGHSFSALSPRPPEPSRRQRQRREHLAAASPETRHNRPRGQDADRGAERGADETPQKIDRRERHREAVAATPRPKL